jgi:hypothetical protein
MPKTFTFIDHDLIPIEKIELGVALSNQPFYGAIKVGKWGWWTLWAGYCSYNFQAVRHLRLNFLNDFSRDLDTGGRNWPLLYQFHDRTQMRFATRERNECIDPLNNSSIHYRLQCVDDCWIHLSGAGYRTKKFQERQEFYQRLAKAVTEGATLRELVKR